MTNSQPFTQMAERIEHNKEAQFGGAAVVISPDGAKIEFLMLDASSDPIQFWSTVKTRIEFVLDDLGQKARVQQGFGR